MALHVVNEAKRCLQCKKPLCKKCGCPIKTPIPQMIQAFLEGQINEAGKMIFDNNPLSLICSLICNHENQCEGNCILNKKGMLSLLARNLHFLIGDFLHFITGADRIVLEEKTKNWYLGTMMITQK